MRNIDMKLQNSYMKAVSLGGWGWGVGCGVLLALQYGGEPPGNQPVTSVRKGVFAGRNFVFVQDNAPAYIALEINLSWRSDVEVMDWSDQCTHDVSLLRMLWWLP